MDGRKRKGITEDGSSVSPRERARRAAAAPYAREDDNPGQNAPPPRLVNNQPHGHGLPMGQQQPGAVVLGGDTSRTGPQGQATAAQGSGNLPPRRKVCPMCRNSSILFDDAMCVRCASEIAAKASVIAAPPPLLPRPRRQEQPHGLHSSPSPANLAFVTNRPIEQQVRGPSVIQNPHPGLLQEAPQAQAQHAPRADDVKQPVLISESSRQPLRPQQHPQPPPPVGAGTTQQQQLLRVMAEQAAGSLPVGASGGAPGALSDARIGLPVLNFQQPPQVHPDMPVGRYYNPIAPVSAAYVEDGRCPACRHYSARKLLQRFNHGNMTACA